MPTHKTKRPRRRPKGEQPPHRGHGSNHAKKKRSKQPPKPLTTTSLAESLKARIEENGGPKGPVEQMASDALERQERERQERARRAMEQAQRRKREQQREASHGPPSRSVALNPQDRALMVELVEALRENTATMERMMSEEAPETDPVADPVEEPMDEDAPGDVSDDESGEDTPEAAIA